MVSISKKAGGVLIVAPVILGALSSGIFYLAEGAAIPLTLFQLALAFGFLIYGLKMVILRELEIEVYDLEVGYLLLLAVIFVSVVYSPNQIDGLFFAVRFVILLSMTYLIYNSLQDWRQFKIIIWVTVIAAVAIGLLSIYDTYNNPETVAFNYLNVGTRLIRSAGGETDPNRFAISLALPFMLLLNLMLTAGNKRAKISLFGLWALILVAILITYSRGAWVALFLSSIITFTHHKKYSPIVYLLLLFAIALIISDSARTVFMSILRRMGDIFAGTKDDSSNFRLYLLWAAIQMFFDTYMLGVGFQGFAMKFQTYYTRQETAGVLEPHNEYYKVFAELGLIGFLIFLFILFKILKTAINGLNIQNQEQETIAVALLSTLVAYLIFFIFFSGMMYNSLFFITVALIFSLKKISNLTAPEQQTDLVNSIP